MIASLRHSFKHVVRRLTKALASTSEIHGVAFQPTQPNIHEHQISNKRNEIEDDRFDKAASFGVTPTGCLIQTQARQRGQGQQGSIEGSPGAAQSGIEGSAEAAAARRGWIGARRSGAVRGQAARGGGNQRAGARVRGQEAGGRGQRAGGRQHREQRQGQRRESEGRDAAERGQIAGRGWGLEAASGDQRAEAERAAQRAGGAERWTRGESSGTESRRRGEADARGEQRQGANLRGQGRGSQ